MTSRREPVAPENEDEEESMNRARCEVVVVGAGIVGTVCACYLRRENRDVMLIDRAGPGEATFLRQRRGHQCHERDARRHPPPA